MKAIRLFFIMVCSVLLMMACGKKSATQSNIKPSDSLQKAVATTQPVSTAKKFKIESGKIVVNMDMMGMKMKQTLYFEDYGNKYLMVDDMGFGKTIQYVQPDGKYVFINEGAKMVKIKNSGADMTNQFKGFDYYTDADKKGAKISVEGTETVAGKPCDKYLVDLPEYKTKGYYWVWKDTNILLKIDVDQSGTKMKWEAESAEPNVKMPADLMTIPAGFKVENQ